MVHNSLFSAVLIALHNLLFSLCYIHLVDMSNNHYNFVTHCVLVQYSLDAFICFTHKQEVIRQTGHGKKADIWSVGCTVIQALARVSAFRIHVCLWVPCLVAVWSWKSVVAVLLCLVMEVCIWWLFCCAAKFCHTLVWDGVLCPHRGCWVICASVCGCCSAVVIKYIKVVG